MDGNEGKLMWDFCPRMVTNEKKCVWFPSPDGNQGEKIVSFLSVDGHQ
jgi:hypothetical protein